MIPEVYITAVLLPLVTAFAETALLTKLFIPFMKRFGLMDDPKRHKHPAMIHTTPIPRGGGISLFLGCLIGAFLMIPITPISIAIFSAAAIALIVGVIDDKLNGQSKDVSPYLRFFIQILTAIIVVASGVSTHFITSPFGGILHFDTWHLFTIPVSSIISVIWLVWIMNMLNWSKGVDGQMPGIVAISAIVIGIVSLRLEPSIAGALIDTKLSFLIAGSAIGFLLFNFYPAKIFPGYGATALYLLLGVASLLSSAKLATAILVMGVPTVDALFTIGRRIANKRSPFLHDNRHLHHLLLRLGYSQRQIALFYWIISAILGLVSLTISSRSKIFAMIMVVVITVGMLLFLHAITKNVDEKNTP